MTEVGTSRVWVDGHEVIIIGTNHVSSKSAKQVQELIRTEKPDTVCVEWDQKRYEKNMNPDSWENTDIIEIIRTKQFPVFMFSIIYKFIQKKVSKEKYPVVGKEYVIAVQEAHTLNSQLVLIDRDSSITFKRAWLGLTFWEKIKLPTAFMTVFDEEEMTEEQMKNYLESENFESVFEQLKEKYPNFWRSFIEERDDYLSTKILESTKGKTVVAVGKAHVSGILERLEQKKMINTKALEEIPSKSVVSKLLKWVMPVLLFSLLVFGFTQGFSDGLEQLKTWIVYKSVCAGIFTVLMLAHPVTIIAAMVLAPITTFIPVISIGMITGLSEAYFRKPRVRDFRELDTDIFSIKKIFKNRVIRIFLIFLFTNIGSNVGNLLGGLEIFKNLF